MNAHAAPLAISTTSTSLPALIDRAVTALTNARSAAEVLEARDLASIAYDIAKKTARLGKAKQAHDEVVGAAYRAQADAAMIEAQAKVRLADEYDAAQDRGEVQSHGGQGKRDIPNENIPSVADVGLSPKDIHEGRLIRDAEKVDPGVVQRTIEASLAAGEEPSKANLRRAVMKVVRPESAPEELECSLDPREPRRARFMNIILEAERLAGEEPDLSALAHFGDLADAAERVVKVWSKILTDLRERAADEKIIPYKHSA